MDVLRVWQRVVEAEVQRGEVVPAIECASCGEPAVRQACLAAVLTAGASAGWCLVSARVSAALSQASTGRGKDRASGAATASKYAAGAGYASPSGRFEGDGPGPGPLERTDSRGPALRASVFHGGSVGAGGGPLMRREGSMPLQLSGSRQGSARDVLAS